MKKIVSLFLAVVMIAATAIPVFAAADLTTMTEHRVVTSVSFDEANKTVADYTATTGVDFTNMALTAGEGVNGSNGLVLHGAASGNPGTHILPISQTAGATAGTYDMNAGGAQYINFYIKTPASTASTMELQLFFNPYDTAAGQYLVPKDGATIEYSENFADSTKPIGTTRTNAYGQFQAPTGKSYYYRIKISDSFTATDIARLSAIWSIVFVAFAFNDTSKAIVVDDIYTSIMTAATLPDAAKVDIVYESYNDLAAGNQVSNSAIYAPYNPELAFSTIATELTGNGTMGLKFATDSTTESSRNANVILRNGPKAVTGATDLVGSSDYFAFYMESPALNSTGTTMIALWFNTDDAAAGIIPLPTNTIVEYSEDFTDASKPITQLTSIDSGCISVPANSAYNYRIRFDSLDAATLELLRGVWSIVFYIHAYDAADGPIYLDNFQTMSDQGDDTIVDPVDPTKAEYRVVTSVSFDEANKTVADYTAPSGTEFTNMSLIAGQGVNGSQGLVLYGAPSGNPGTHILPISHTPGPFAGTYDMNTAGAQYINFYIKTPASTASTMELQLFFNPYDTAAGQHLIPKDGATIEYSENFADQTKPIGTTTTNAYGQFQAPTGKSYYYRIKISDSFTATDIARLSAIWSIVFVAFAFNDTSQAIVVDDIYTSIVGINNIPADPNQNATAFRPVSILEDYNRITGNDGTMYATEVGPAARFASYLSTANAGINRSNAMVLIGEPTVHNASVHLRMGMQNTVGYADFSVQDADYFVFHLKMAGTTGQHYVSLGFNTEAGGLISMAEGTVIEYCEDFSDATKPIKTTTVLANNSFAVDANSAYYYRINLKQAYNPAQLTALTRVWSALFSVFDFSADKGEVVIDNLLLAKYITMPASATPSAWANAEVNAAQSGNQVPVDLRTNYNLPITKAQMSSLIATALNAMGAPATVNNAVAGYLSGGGNVTRLDAARIYGALHDALGIIAYGVQYSFIDSAALGAADQALINTVYETDAMIPTDFGSFLPAATLSIEEAIVGIYRIGLRYSLVKQRYVFTVSNAYGNGMIFQRNTTTKVTGTAPAGAQIQYVLYNSQNQPVDTGMAVTPASGKWAVTINGQPGSFERYSLYITQLGVTSVTFTDIMFGEVWVAGGQSNMQYHIEASAEVDYWRTQADYSKNIRIYHQPTNVLPGDYAPRDNTPEGSWVYANSFNAVKDCSAVAMIFAYQLYDQLNAGNEDIPVGIIYNAVGGTAISTWLSREEIENNPAMLKHVKDGRIYFDKSTWGTWPSYFIHDVMTTLYNNRVAPFEGYTAAGIIYYQGCGNTGNPDPYNYTKDGLEALVNTWSKIYGNGKQLPIIVSELANYNYPHYSTIRCEINEGYRDGAAKINANGGKAYVTAIYDVEPLWGEIVWWGKDPIHPNVKRPVGERMANTALTEIYGKDIVWNGPYYKSMEVSNGKIIITFDNYIHGIKPIRGETLRGFTIAGADLVYYPAKATIIAPDKVELTSESVPNPIHATYAYTNVSFAANAGNSANLPMIPFRTDKTKLAFSMAPNSGAYYTVENQWHWFDSLDVWNLQNTGVVTDPVERKIPQWISGSQGTTTFAIDTVNKTEGDGALQVTYSTTTNAVSIAPNIAAQHRAPIGSSGYDAYLPMSMNNYLLIDVIGFSGTGLSLGISDGANTNFLNGTVYQTNGNAATYLFDLTQASAEVRNAAHFMELFFYVAQGSSGTVLVDNLRLMKALPNTVKYSNITINHVGTIYNADHTVNTANVNLGSNNTTVEYGTMVNPNQYILSQLPEGYAFASVTPDSFVADQDNYTITINYHKVLPKELTGIAVTTRPSKVTYFVGDTFDATGMVVTATYNDNSTAAVTDYTVSGFDSATAGTKVITVTYQGKQATFNVTVETPVLTGIAVTTRPSKVTYFVGDTFDATGMVVTATYNDNSSAAVTDYTVSGFDSATAGTKVITVTYQGKQATFNVTVETPVLTGIAVTTRPSRLTYFIGDTFNATGMVVTATYNNNSSAEVTDYTVSGFDSTTAGTKVITVTYQGMQAIFNVTVESASLTEIAITTRPSKLTYFVGDTFDATGMVVTASYNNNSSAEVIGYTVSGFDSATTGSKVITVTYQGKQATFTVTVEAPVLTGIAVTTRPSKLTYTVGDTFNAAGMVVTATYNNNSSAAVTDYTVSGFDSTTAGTKVITVTYQGMQATFTVTVEAAVLTGIAVTTRPLKLTYFVGDTFDATGMIVTATYSDHSTEQVTGYTVSGFDSATAGNKVITVTYQGKQATFNVMINQKLPTTITSSKVKVSSDTISKITAGMTAEAFLNSLNEKEYVKLYSGNKEVSGKTVVATGMVAKLMHGATVVKTYTIVVTGDTNGDGKITITDFVQIKSHLLGKSTLKGAAAAAADTDGNGKISITDFVQIKSHLLGKSKITAR